ncbi:MAG: hypothetical protein JSS82_06735 [Bacteroidetes bacterium]|nr:hypothetical protein [Bacteroidota bacterium]
MKYIAIVAAFCLFVLSACTHKNAVLPTTVTPTTSGGGPAAGNWTVISYTDQGVDETPDFGGYTFVFNTDGTFTATRKQVSVTGNWSMANDDSRQKLVLTISSAADAHLAELNEDWIISLMTETNINLLDDKGHHDLRFQKQ